MSFQGLNYDTSTYEQKLRDSIGPGIYQLGTPANDCTACGQDVPFDPYLRWQNWGPGFCKPGTTVDVGSDLLGITRKASRCAADQYLPSKALPTSAGCTPRAVADVECAAPTEPTRLSNPPCNMREWGNNRWEWLCWDPQEHAIQDFDWNISNRIVTKDNHKPCLPMPIPQDNVWPTTNSRNANNVVNVGGIQPYQPPTQCGGTGAVMGAPGGQAVWNTSSVVFEH